MFRSKDLTLASPITPGPQPAHSLETIEQTNTGQIHRFQLLCAHLSVLRLQIRV